MLGHTTSTSSSTSSSSQYIRPDFGGSSTMDAQKSPLAMLAATCNSIGAPDLQKTIKNVELPPTSKRSAPLSTAGSENKRPKPNPDTPTTENKSSTKSSPSTDASHKRDSPEKDPKEKSEKADKDASKEKSESEARKSPKTSQSPRLGSKTPPKPTPRSPHGLPLPVSFPTVHGASPLSDPLNFVARMKNGGGAGMPHMMPGYCRDPFCYGCSASQSLHCATNPPMTPMDYSALSPFSSLGALGSLTPSGPGGKSLVCNWISPGENYCGKRFTSSEELFAHLRTHTNLTVNGNGMPSSASANGLSSLDAGLLHSAYANYASYLSRFPSLAASAAASRYNPLFKSPLSNMSMAASGAATAYPSLWPTASPTSGFFSPSPYSYYRPPF
ncbi:hypothetical protein RvY_16156 [Ramazzottius varieornatus]|uniref:C2H2-type domain-containing protein n=1 Tax=Ramazzottius varieornatus TaxID=947166 RepID=A0A1D1VXG4_RAMVA|nr:hypothetical protein RvY_16156 [Ramazzottius varieornatus]